MKQNGHTSSTTDGLNFASATTTPSSFPSNVLNNNLTVKFVPILAKSPQRELRPFTNEVEHLNIMTKQQSRQHSIGCHETNSFMNSGASSSLNRPISPSIPEHSVAQYLNGCSSASNSYGHLSALENVHTDNSSAASAKQPPPQESNLKSNSSVAPTHWYQGFLNRTSRAIPSKVMFRSTSHTELKKSDGGARSPSYSGCENSRGNGNGVVRSVNVAASSSSTSYSLENGSPAKADGNGSTATTTTNVLLPRREYGSTSSIDQLLAQQTDQRRLQRNPKQPQPSKQQQQCSSAFSNHNHSGVVVVETASSSSGSQSSRSSSDSAKKFFGSGPLEHNRASLRREKAVDLPSYASAELQQQQQRQLQHQQQNSLPASLSNNKNESSKFYNKKQQLDTKAKTSRSKSSNESILKKLIGGGSKSASTDDSPNMAGPGQNLNSRDSIKPDFSSDSLDFKSEEKIRKRIFAHYDCGSISATPIPLLNGRSRLEEGNLNAATGASQASRPKPTSPSGATDTPWLINDDPSSAADLGDTKSNDIVLSCPYFRNELGGEPLRTVSLSRTVSERQQSNRTLDDGLETWLRPSTAAESSVLENLSNVYLGGRLCASRQDNLIIEYVDQGAFYYRHCFSGKAHHNYFGTDENLGPVAISVVRDKVENFSDYKKLGLTSPYIYRIIVRLSDMNTFRGTILEESLPSYQSAREQQCMQQTSTPPGSVVNSGKIPVKELLELTIPDLQLNSLRLAVPVPRTEELLLKLDEQTVYTRYKVGILYCRADQCTEEQMYNNGCASIFGALEVAGAAFEEFLDMLGQRIRLKGFDKYKGGLDNKGDTTGQFSLYTTYQQYEIMFHVSTMLPYTSNNKQQLSRKRHIGNDIVTIIFQDPGALPFSAQTVRSHFQHVFLVVRAQNPNTDKLRYSAAVSRCKDVPPFGPPIPHGAVFPKSKEFRDFILTKIINAENAVHKSDKFATMAARTRKEFMRDLAENHITSHSLEGASGKIGKILGSKRRDRPKPKLFLDNFVRGAIVWEVQVLVMVEDFSLCKSVECLMGISVDYVVLIEQSKSQDVLFCTPSHSIIGWTSHGNSLKLYYDHAEVIILRSVDDDDATDMQEILKRLQAVTKGCDTVEMILRRNPTGQLGFHIQHEGIVSDVEMYGSAWQAGLRQGSRLVEICKVNVATLTLDRMLELLRTSNNIRVLVVPPLEDGSPRRGCEDPYCPSVMSDESAIAQYLVDQPHHPNRKHPPSYETAVMRKQLIMPTTVLTLEPESPSDRAKNGYDTVGGTPFSKSLDELQGRRRHSEELRSNSADHNFYNTRKTTAGGYPVNTLSSISSEEPWYQGNDGQGGTSKRADTFSSSGSDDSNSGRDFPKRSSVKPLELKRKVDKTYSDMMRRMSEDVGASAEPKGAPRLPPKTYKQKFVPGHHVSMSSGQLTVPLHYSPLKSTPRSSNSLQENLLRLTSEQSFQNLNDLLPDNSADAAGLQLPEEGKKFFLSPETERGIEWSSLVDAATRAIEGMTKNAMSTSNSPETGYHLKYQAALQRIKLLEEKSDRLLYELEKERETKRELEVEILALRNINKRLEEECLTAQLELKKFTEWFFRAVDENTSGNSGDKHSESNNNRKESTPK